MCVGRQQLLLHNSKNVTLASASGFSMTSLFFSSPGPALSSSSSNDGMAVEILPYYIIGPASWNA
jgi:hypothetical protein